MVMCGRCFATYHLGMILAIFRLDPLGNRTWDPRRTKPACWPLHCRDRQRESPKLSSCLIPKSMSLWAIIMISLGKAKCTYVTVRYLYLWLVNISHTAEAWTIWCKVWTLQFATYHLGMISAIIQVGPIENRTRLLGVPDLHAHHYTVGIGKEKAPNFPVAWYRNLCHCGRSLW